MCLSCDERNARAKNGRWKPTVTLLLPGDDLLFLEAEIGRAQRRDNRLSTAEYGVQHATNQCAWRQAKYSSWHCSWRDPCPFCEEALCG
jgi:hypothetical protein